MYIIPTIHTKRLARVLSSYNKQVKGSCKLNNSAMEKKILESKTTFIYEEGKKPYIIIPKTDTRTGMDRRLFTGILIPSLRAYKEGLTNNIY